MVGEAMPMIEAMNLQRQPNYFGHVAPFHCFTGDFKGRTVSVVTNGKDKKYGCDNVSTTSSRDQLYHNFCC